MSRLSYQLKNKDVSSLHPREYFFSSLTRHVAIRLAISVVFNSSEDSPGSAKGGGLMAGGTLVVDLPRKDGRMK